MKRKEMSSPRSFFWHAQPVCFGWLGLRMMGDEARERERERERERDREREPERSFQSSSVSTVQSHVIEVFVHLENALTRAFFNYIILYPSLSIQLPFCSLLCFWAL